MSKKKRSRSSSLHSDYSGLRNRASLPSHRTIPVITKVPSRTPAYIDALRLIRLAKPTTIIRRGFGGPIIKKRLLVRLPRPGTIGKLSISGRGISVSTKRHVAPRLGVKVNSPVVSSTGVSSFKLSRRVPVVRRRVIAEQHTPRRREVKWTSER